MRQAFFLFFLTGAFLCFRGEAQQKPAQQLQKVADSTLEKNDRVYKGNNMPKETQDSIDKKMQQRYHRATIYSAVMPGAGQIYNKKYWKLPLVYAAVGIPAYLFFYNKGWYQKSQYALTVAINQSGGDSLAKVAPELLPLVTTGNTNAIINVRDQFRQDQDYAALFFLLFYALNIVDATVDAHLKDFNVNSDISFRIKPMIIPGPTPIAGFTLAFDVHKPVHRLLGMN